MRFKDMGILYNKLHSWLADATPGERRTKGVFKYYQKELWDPILKILDDISKDQEITENERKFLECVLYRGTIYRKQNYREKNRGHVQFHEYYQSGSKNLESLSGVSNYSGQILLITTKEIQGINIRELLCFMYLNGYTNTSNSFKNINVLSRYLKEEEIVFPMREENIKEIRIINHDNILNSGTTGKVLERSKWRRNSI